MLEDTSRYIDPLTDFGFKRLFGREQNKDIMISFLNSLFEGQKVIVDVSFGQTEYGSENDQFKKVFFDLMCTTEDGSQMIIEMQRNPQPDFDGRCVYYLSKIISEQLLKGQADAYNGLKSVCLIGILDFRFKDSSINEYFHQIGLKNHRNGNIFYRKLDLKFLELPGFNKIAEELVTDLDKWFFILKNMRHLDRIPDCMDKPVFQKIFRIAEIINLTKEERMFFDANSKAEWDYKRSIEYAAEQAVVKVAAKMKNEGFSTIQILDLTKLPLEVVENLK